MSKRGVVIVLSVVLLGMALFFLWPDSPVAKQDAARDSLGQGDTATARRARAGKRALPSHPLKKSGGVSGRIVDLERKGIAGAQVCAVSFADVLTGEDQQSPNCVLADQSGRFSFPYLWAGSHSIEATARGYLPANDIDGEVVNDDAWAGDLKIEEGQKRDDLVIVLTPGGVELVGAVTDVGGGPIAGAWVELHPLSLLGENLPTASARAMSDDEGVVRLWLAEGNYSTAASAEGYVSERSELVVPGMDLRIALVPGSTLRGSVVYGEDGEPAPYALVSTSQTRGGRYSARADEGGEFLLTRLPAGRYQVSAASDEGRGAAPRSVMLGLAQDVDGVVIPLEPGVRVAGVVVRKGSDKPCKSQWIMLMQKGQQPLRAKGEGEEGKVHIDAVPPGNYEIRVGCDEGISDSAGALEVKSEDILDQRWTVDEGLSLRVLVRDESGAGVPQAGVRVSEAKEMDFFSGGGGGYGRSDGEGIATIRGLSKGKFKVEVNADALAMKNEATEIDLKENGQELTVVMTGGGAIAGVVRVSEGKLPTGLTVTARAVTGDDDPFAGMMSSLEVIMVLDDGSFRIEGLAAGSYRLDVSQGRWSFQDIETKEDETYQVALGSVTEAQLTIEGRTGSVRGQVVDSRNQPVVDAFVRVIKDPGDGRQSLASMQLRDSYFGKDATLADAEGRFEVHGLPEGPYVVRAYRRGGGEALEKGVAEGSEVTLTIADTGSIAGTVLSSSGAPIKSYSIHCKNTKTNFDRKERFTGADGQFRIEDLPPGSYVLSVTADEGSVASDDLTLAVGGTIENVDLRVRSRGTLIGRVVSLADGTPVEGMRVNARAARGDLGAGSFMGDIRSGADGRFELKEVPAGPVVLLGFLMGGTPGESGEWGPVSARADIPPGGEVDLGDLVVARMQTSFKEAGDLGFELKDAGNLMEGPQELFVGTVDEKGPAHEAGLRPGDQIVAVNGQDLTGGNSYLFFPLSMVAVGSTVRLGLEGGKELSITAAPRKGK